MADQYPPQAIQQEVFDLYDDYAHNRIDRRDFVQQLAAYATAGLSVAALLAMLTPAYAGVGRVGAQDPRLQEAYISYPSPKGGGSIKGLLCQPAKAEGRRGGVVVVHENRGLNPYIETVCREAALAGFVALAPDALTPLGGYPGNDDEGRAMQARRNREEMLEDFISAAQWLQQQPACNGKVAVVGFCFGGWVANMMAVRMPGLAAAVPYYGGQPDAADVPALAAPLQLHYAALDTRVNAGWPAYEAALKTHSKVHQAYIYEGVNHGFHNYSTPRFDETAARLAWERTLAFFEQHLHG